MTWDSFYIQNFVTGSCYELRQESLGSGRSVTTRKLMLLSRLWVLRTRCCCAVQAARVGRIRVLSGQYEFVEMGLVCVSLSPNGHHLIWNSFCPGSQAGERWCVGRERTGNGFFNRITTNTAGRNSETIFWRHSFKSRTWGSSFTFWVSAFCFLKEILSTSWKCCKD